MKREVHLRPAAFFSTDGDLAAAAAAVNGDAQRALALAKTLVSVPRPGEGHTMQLFDALSTLGAADLTAARVAEAHLDALAILRQAGHAQKPDHSWGVFAAEGPETILTATKVDSGWQLDGIKPWCSLAGLLSHALVTAHVARPHGDSGRRRNFAPDETRHRTVARVAPQEPQQGSPDQARSAGDNSAP